MRTTAITPHITVAIGQQVRLYHAYITTAPAALDAPSTITVYESTVTDLAGFAFEPNSLDAIVAFNVFHHLPDVSGFLRGASSVLRPGGKICLVEPWFTSVGQLFHRLIHHEPYRDDPSDWRLVGEGRMTGANTRLPTSVFRDSDERFQREFPQLVLRKRQPFHKWLYLASGGLKLNTHVPAPIARGLVALDRRVRFGDEALGLFALVVVERI